MKPPKKKVEKIKPPKKNAKKTEATNEVFKSAKIVNKMPDKMSDIQMANYHNNLLKEPKILHKNAKIKRIFFLSDIHILNDSSHDKKYHSVFENVIEAFKKKEINSETDLICLCGDIVNESLLSGSAIRMVKYLYTELTKLAFVVSILGNHEYKEEIDVLTPIIDKDFPTKNGKEFLLKNGVYIYGNIAFGHTRFDSCIATSCEEYNKKYTTIGLYHGIMNGCSLDNDISGRSHFKISDFKGYDYCAFGDVHKRQWLDDGFSFYIGSLLEHNISESHYGHGFSIIDVDKEKITFHNVQNDYKRIHIKTKNGKIPDDILEYIENTDIKYLNIQIDGCNDSMKSVDNLKKILNDNKIPFEMKFRPSIDVVNIDTDVMIDNKKYKLKDLQNTGDFKKFLLKFIQLKNELVDVDRMKNSISHVFEYITNEKNLYISEQLHNEKQFSIIGFDIKNLMIFGNTSINFSNASGVIGICENNSMGKSTICEFMSIALHGKSPRCSDQLSFIRNNCKECEITAILKMNNIKYEINRKIIKASSIQSQTIITIKKYIDDFNFVAYTDNKQFALSKTQGIEYIDRDSIKQKINDILSYDEIYKMFVISQEREKSLFKDNEKVNLLFNAANLGFINVAADACDSIIQKTRKNTTSYITKHIPEKFMEGLKLKIEHKNYDKIVKHIRKKIAEYIATNEQYKNDYNDTKKKYEDAIEKNAKNVAFLKNNEKYEQYEEEPVDDLVERGERIYEEAMKYKKIKNDLCGKNQEIIELIEQNDLKIKKMGNIEEKYNEWKIIKTDKIIKYNEKIKVYEKNVVPCVVVTLEEKNNALKNNEDLIKKLNGIKQEILVMKNKRVVCGDIKKLMMNYEEYINCANRIENCNKIVGVLKKLTNTKQILKIIDEINSEKAEIMKNMKLCENYKKDFDNYDSGENIDDVIENLNNNKYLMEADIKKNEKIVNDFEICQKNEEWNMKISNYENLLLNEKNSEMIEYDEYLRIVDENKKFTNQLELNDAQIQLNVLNMKTCFGAVRENNKKINDIVEEEEEYEKYIKLKNNHKIFLGQFEEIKKKYKNACDKHDNDIVDTDQTEKIIEAVQENLDLINDVVIIGDLIKAPEIGISILEKIVASLQSSLDEMCNFIDHERIYITVKKSENGKCGLDIHTDTVKNIANAGGFKSRIMELLFKVAFLKINAMFETDFLIVDEIYDACSVENFPMAKKLIEFFKTKYKRMLIVSHNRDVKKLFDNTISIKRDEKNGNQIMTNF